MFLQPMRLGGLLLLDLWRDEHRDVSQRYRGPASGALSKLLSAGGKWTDASAHGFKAVQCLEQVPPAAADTDGALSYNLVQGNGKPSPKTSLLANVSRIAMAKRVGCILIAMLGLTSTAPMWAQATLVPLLPSAAPSLATGPGTVTITAQPSQQVNGKGTVTLTLPGSLPIITCPKGAGYSQCLGPATVHITHTLTGFDSYLISISQDGLSLQKVGNTTIQQCDDRDYGNKFTPRTSFDCQFDWLPYFTGSFATYSTDIKVDIITTGNFTDIDYPVDFQWGPDDCAASANSSVAESKVSSTKAVRDTPATCPTASIVALHVVQETTDTPADPITLIAGKPTLVRLYATSPIRKDNVTAVLHGYRGTQPTELSPGPNKPPGPLSPMSSFPSSSSITLSSSLDPQAPNDISKSLNFLLPAEWIGSGDLTLTAELQVKSPSGTISRIGDSFTKTVAFQVSAHLRIAYIPFCYLYTETGLGCATDQVGNYAEELKDFYPIKSDNVNYYQLFGPFPVWRRIIRFQPTSFPFLFFTSTVGEFKAYLEKIFLLSVAGHADMLAGWLPHSPDAPTLLGESVPPFMFGSGHIFVGFESKDGFGTPDRQLNSETLAHEVGHNLGLHHTGSHFSNDPSGTFFNWCGDIDPISTVVWPYTSPNAQQPGFNFTSNTLRASNWGDMMSYCHPQGISPYDVRQLLKNPLLQPPSPAGPQARRVPAVPQASGASSSEQIVISGWAQSDGTAGWLDPLYRMPLDGTAAPSLASGSHCLHFTGAAGALGDYCFQLAFQNVEDTAPLDRQYFALVAPLPVGATRVDLMAGTKQLASLRASSSPPTLVITSPHQGDTWNGGMQTVAWTASDPDNLPVVSTVLYSYDGGQSWISMALDISDSRFTFDPAQIMGGNNVFLRVMATDGMNSTSADVGPIQVMQTPTISVGPSVDFGTQQVGAAPIQDLAISNPGSGPLMVNSLSIDNPAFTVAPAQAPIGIAAGSTRSLSIQWTPTSSGAQTGTLTLTSNDPANPTITLLLSGTATPAGSSCIFGLSATASPAVAGGGVGGVNVSAIASTCSWTAASNVPWIAITAGASGTGAGQVAYTVAPNPNLTNRSGTLTIAGLTYTVTQSVWAPGAGPTISVSPESLTFGPVTLGQPPTTMKLTISNTGKADLHVTAINQTGDPSFSLVPKFTPLTIAGAKSADITVQFAPTAAGTPSGSLSIMSDDPANNSVQISLSGTVNPATTGPGACLPPPANPVSWWTGDGNANDLVGGDNGTLQGGASFSAGEVGQAFQFDGNTGYVSIGNPANLRITNAMTIEAWINPRSGPPSSGAAGTNMAAVLTKWGQNFNPTADSDSYGLWLRANGSSLTMFSAIHQSGTSEPNLQGGTIPLNTWSHVAMTFDSASGQFVLYVNAQVVARVNSPGAITATSRNVLIGREDSFLPRPFNGLIDEVSVYSRALTGSEIQAIFNAGSAGKCKPAGGTSSTPPKDVVLQVDGGTFNGAVGFPTGTNTAVFVNRLTPPSYPATLKTIQVYFGNRANGLAADSPISLIIGTNSSGSSSFSASTLDALYQADSKVVATGAFNSYTVSPPITISSGDFVIGFATPNAANVYPADEDQTSPSQKRSYISSDGAKFAIVDTFSPQVSGNFGIRATVAVGAAQTAASEVSTVHFVKRSGGFK